MQDVRCGQVRAVTQGLASAGVSQGWTAKAPALPSGNQGVAAAGCGNHRLPVRLDEHALPAAEAIGAGECPWAPLSSHASMGASMVSAARYTKRHSLLCYAISCTGLDVHLLRFQSCFLSLHLNVGSRFILHAVGGEVSLLVKCPSCLACSASWRMPEERVAAMLWASRLMFMSKHMSLVVHSCHQTAVRLEITTVYQ